MIEFFFFSFLIKERFVKSKRKKYLEKNCICLLTHLQFMTISFDSTIVTVGIAGSWVYFLFMLFSKNPK